MTPAPPPRRWIKVGEASVLYGAHPQTLYAGLLSGVLPGAKLPGLGWRIDRLELERRLECDIAERTSNGKRKNQ